jgi:hypothetical protein
VNHVPMLCSLLCVHALVREGVVPACSPRAEGLCQEGEGGVKRQAGVLAKTWAPPPAGTSKTYARSHHAPA